MEGDRLLDLISGSLDQVLSPEESAELASELAASPEARQLLSQLQGDRALLRTLPALPTPSSLRSRTKTKVLLASSPQTFSLKRYLMLAASVLLALGLFWYIRPVKTLLNSRLYLRPGAIAAKAAEVSEELHLAAANGQRSEVLISEPLTGQFNGGITKLVLLADAGAVAGGRLTVRLAYDCDGDGVFEAHSEPKVFLIDAKEGYEPLTCVWSEMPALQNLTSGKVQVELLADNDVGPPLRLNLDPSQVHLELPYDDLQLGEDSLPVEA